MTRALPLLFVALLFVGCGKSPAAPSDTGQTRIISVSGPLAFGPVAVGTLAQKSYTVTNSGSATLSLTGITATGSGFGAGADTSTLFPGETTTVNVIFLPSVAGSVSSTIAIASNATSGSGVTTVTGTGTVAAGLVAQSFQASISGGDAHCLSGKPPFTFDSGACQVFDFPITTAGRVDAILTYNGDDALLSLELYDPVAGDNIARGDLSFDPYPLKGEHSALSANVQPGAYQLRVRVITSSKITTISVNTAHP